MTAKKEGKKVYSFRFDITLIEKIRKLGEIEQRDLTNMIEHVLTIFEAKYKKKQK